MFLALYCKSNSTSNFFSKILCYHSRYQKPADRSFF